MSEVALENFPCHIIVDRTVGFLERLPRLMIKERREFNSMLFAPKNQKEREKKNFNLISGEAQQGKAGLKACLG